MAFGKTAIPDLLNGARRPGRPRRAPGPVAGRGRRRLLFWLLPWLILSPGGCAYYNTFFYAKKNYAKAQRIEEGSTTDRLSPEAVKSYDQAIEKCNKVILGYGGGWRAGIDDALFLMGQCYYGKREYETAIGKFDEVILNYPDSDHVPEALFYAGLCYHHLRNFGTATQIFDGLLTQYPDFEGQDEILFVAAEGLETAGDLGGALKQYALIIERFPESRRREDALERVGTIHFEAAHYDSALEAYSVLARTSRDDAVYIEAQFRRGSCLVRLNRPAEALDIYERILPDDAERQELGGRAWLAMAEAYNRDGRHEEALERLERVVENFQNRPAAIEALFMTGYTYEVYLRQYEEAEKAYQAAVDDRSRSVFRDQAVRRLQNLRNVMELAREDEGASDREQRALAALKVAEFSLLETLEPRVALDQYAGVEQDFPETDAARRASYARGWIFYHNLDSLARAEEILSHLIEAHPGSNQAAGARTLLERMELPAERLAVFDSLIERAQAEERARADSLEAAAPGDSTAPAAADSLEVLPNFEPAAADSLVALPKFEPTAADSLVALPMFEPPSADSLEAFPVFESPSADSVMREDVLRMRRPEGPADGDSLADSTALEAPAPDSTAAPPGDEP